MKHLLAVIAVVGGVALTGSQPETLTFTNVTVIDATGAAAHVANVTVRNGTIAQIAAASPRAEGTAIDGTGKFLIPGLWDMHVHLATRPEPELAERMMFPLFIANGIVGVRDMGGPLERVLALREKVAAGSLAGPRVLTPGPFVDGPGEADALFRRPADATAAVGTVKELLDKKVDFIKVQSALAPDVHAAIARAAREAHTTFAGHIPVSMSAKQAIAAGQRSLEHLSPALVDDGMLMFACSNRSEQLLAELRAIERDRAAVDASAIAHREQALRTQLVDTYDPGRAKALGRTMKGHDVWIVPTLVWSATLRPLARSKDGTDLPMEFVPMGLRTRWMDRRKQYIGRQTDDGFAAAATLAATAGRAVHDLRDGGARVLAGTDAFDAFVLPGDSLHQELELLVSAGLSPLEALQAATKTAAEYRGAQKTEGTIERGKRADLVLLDADPTGDISNARRIHGVLTGGVWYSRSKLDRMLDEVRTFASQ